jgi:hypothetical protein
MTLPVDLKSPDQGNGSLPGRGRHTDPHLYVQNAGTLTEYATATGVPTGRVWRNVPSGDTQLAYNGSLFIAYGSTLVRLQLSDDSRANVYEGSGVSEFEPCGDGDVCALDGTTLLAIHGTQVRWQAPMVGAIGLAPVGTDLRVTFRADGAISVALLDADGHERLRVPTDSMFRLDAGNLFGVREQLSPDSTRYKLTLTGITAATPAEIALGETDMLFGVAGAGDTIAVYTPTELVVYRVAD